MRTGAMLAIAEQMDRCGFESMEFFGFAGYIKMVREHRENPWDWMRLGAKKFHRTRLRYHGGLVSDEELVLRVIAGDAAVEAMLATGAPKEYLSTKQPLVELIGELTKRRDCSQVYVRKGDLVLRIEKRGSPPVYPD